MMSGSSGLLPIIKAPRKKAVSKRAMSSIVVLMALVHRRRLDPAMQTSVRLRARGVGIIGETEPRGRLSA